MAVEENTGNSSNLLFRTNGDPQPQRVFRFLENYGDKMGTRKNIQYRLPKAVTTGKKWYVEYYYRIPENLRPEYGNKVWKRFKVFEDINRIKTVEYTEMLREAVKTFLEDGFSPFKKEYGFISDQTNEFKSKRWTIQQGLLFFKQKWRDRGLEASSMRKYETTADRLIEWFTARKLQHSDLEEVTNNHIEAYLFEKKKEKGWSNRSFNNERDFTSTIFNFFLDKKMISIHPGKGIVELKTASKKHRYYDEAKFKTVRELMAEHDPLLFFASKLVYYLCIRSEKELKNLKLENILIERKQVLIQAEDSKTDTDRMIPIPEDLLTELIDLKKWFPKATYVIGVPSKNKFTPTNLPGQHPFGNGFLSKRFAKIRKLAKLTSDYTLFGMRHTRCIHLKLDGAKDSDIMNLMGHADFATTAKYLRDLGIATDEGRISKLTRKF